MVDALGRQNSVAQDEGIHRSEMIIDTVDLVKERNIFILPINAEFLNALDFSEFHLNDDDKTDNTYPEDDQVFVYRKPLIGCFGKNCDTGLLGPQM